MTLTFTKLTSLKNGENTGHVPQNSGLETSDLHFFIQITQQSNFKNNSLCTRYLNGL